MSLIRRQDAWNPFRDLDDMSSRMGRLFSRSPWLGSEREELAAMDWAPACNVSETDTEYRIRAELPSVNKENVNVTIDEGVLTLQGERREEKEEKGEKFHRRELSYGNFMRRFAIPADGDIDKIDANFKDGTLLITIPKNNGGESKPRQISVG